MPPRGEVQSLVTELHDHVSPLRGAVDLRLIY